MSFGTRVCIVYLSFEREENGAQKGATLVKNFIAPASDRLLGPTPPSGMISEPRLVSPDHYLLLLFLFLLCLCFFFLSSGEALGGPLQGCTRLQILFPSLCLLTGWISL